MSYEYLGDIKKYIQQSRFVWWWAVSVQKRLQCTGRIHNAEGAFYRPSNCFTLYRKRIGQYRNFEESLHLRCWCSLSDRLWTIWFFRNRTTLADNAKTIRTYFPDYDLILFGRLAYDGDAVNVSTQVSCHLGIPRVVYSREIYTKDQVLYARKYISSSKEAVYRLKRPVLIHRSIFMIC